MNKKKLALEVLSSPHMKKIASLNLVNKATLHRMIAEEVVAEVRVSAEDDQAIMQLDDYLQGKKGVYEKVKAFLNAVDKKADPEQLKQMIANELQPQQFALNETIDEWEEQFDQIKRFVAEKNLNEASRLILGELEKRIKLINEKWKLSNTKQHEDPTELYVDMNVWLKAYENGVSIITQHMDQMDSPQAQGPEKETGDPAKDAALEHLASVFEAINDNLSNWRVGNFLRASEQKDDKFKEKTLEAVKTLGGTPEAAAEEVASFYGEDLQIPTGKWFELYQLMIGSGQRVGQDQVTKIITAMGKVNDLATEQKDIFWSTEEGFSQVIEVAFLQSGSDVVNNGKEEKPLQQYNVSADDLNTGDVGTVLIVRSSELFKVEKLVAEQEEPTQTVTDSIPITTVKEFNDLFIGKENEEGLPTAPGAFFVKSSAEKMIPLGAKPEEKPQTQPEETSVDPQTISQLEAAFAAWSDGFMEVRTLLDQSKIFGELWAPIGEISEKGKGQPIRSITRKMASREEESQLDEASYDFTPGQGSVARDPKQAEKEAADDMKRGGIDSETGEKIDAEKAMQQSQDPAPETEEARRDVLEGLVVAQRHSEKLVKVLELYEKYAQRLTGKEANKFFKKFGTSDVRGFLYKSARLVVKDVNFLLEKVSELEGPESKLSEALLEVEGETYSDQIRKVEAVNALVTKQVPLLLRLLKPQADTDQTTEPEQQAAEPEEPEVQKENVSASQQLSAKETAIKIYDSMATIKTYFPTVSPLDSDYKVNEVIDKMKEVLKVLTEHLSAMMRFKSDKAINKASLRSARVGLEQIKANLLDMFGINDEGQPATPSDNEAAYSPEGEQAVESDDLEAPTTTAPEVEVEEEEDEEEVTDKVKNFAPEQITQLDTHFRTKILPPDIFKEMFPSITEQEQLEASYDAVTLVLMLNNMQLIQNEQEEKMAIPPKNLSLIKQKLLTSGLISDKEKVENIIMTINRYFPQRAAQLSFFLKQSSRKELVQLNRLIIKNTKMYPFKIQLKQGQMPTFIKKIGGKDVFKDKKTSEPPRRKLGSKERRDARRGTMAPFDGRAEGDQWRPGDRDQYYTNEQRVTNSALLEKKLEKIIKTILNNRKQ